MSEAEPVPIPPPESVSDAEVREAVESALDEFRAELAAARRNAETLRTLAEVSRMLTDRPESYHDGDYGNPHREKVVAATYDAMLRILERTLAVVA